MSEVVEIDEDVADEAAALLKDWAGHLYENNATTPADKRHGLERQLNEDTDTEWTDL